jgi:predicted SAM-dependent methyltransferase
VERLNTEGRIAEMGGPDFCSDFYPIAAAAMGVPDLQSFRAMLAKAFRALVQLRLTPSVRRALREVKFELYLQRLHRTGMHAARLFNGQRGLRLNLGSGHHPKPGWVNVDLLAPTVDLRLDLRERLPFANDTAELVYCEHFFEHLCYPNLDVPQARELEPSGHESEALQFLRECQRVLTPGGTLHLVVPDVEGIIQQYVDRRRIPFPLDHWWGPKWCDTPLHCVNYVFRQGTEHKYAYDDETLQLVLRRAGFVHVRRREFDPSLDADNHCIGSLCVVAQKRQDVAAGDAGQAGEAGLAGGTGQAGRTGAQETLVAAQRSFTDRTGE